MSAFFVFLFTLKILKCSDLTEVLASGTSYDTTSVDSLVFALARYSEELYQADTNVWDTRLYYYDIDTSELDFESESEFNDWYISATGIDKVVYEKYMAEVDANIEYLQDSTMVPSR